MDKSVIGHIDECGCPTCQLLVILADYRGNRYEALAAILLIARDLMVELMGEDVGKSGIKRFLFSVKMYLGIGGRDAKHLFRTLEKAQRKIRSIVKLQGEAYRAASLAEPEMLEAIEAAANPASHDSGELEAVDPDTLDLAN